MEAGNRCKDECLPEETINVLLCCLRQSRLLCPDDLAIPFGWTLDLKLPTKAMAEEVTKELMEEKRMKASD